MDVELYAPDDEEKRTVHPTEEGQRLLTASGASELMASAFVAVAEHTGQLARLTEVVLVAAALTGELALLFDGLGVRKISTEQE